MNLPAAEGCQVEEVTAEVVDLEVQVGVHAAQVHKQARVLLVDRLEELKLPHNQLSQNRSDLPGSLSVWS